MDNYKLQGFVIWFTLLQSNISAETSSASDSKISPLFSVSHNNAKDGDFDKEEMLAIRNKRDVNADKIFVEINRLYDKIDEFSKQFEKMNALFEFRKTKMDEILAKIENSLSSLSAKTDQNKLADETNFDEMGIKLGRIEELVSEKSTECFNKIKEKELADSSKYVDIEVKFSKIQQWISQQDIQVSSTIQESISAATNTFTTDLGINVNQLEDTEVDEQNLRSKWSNRIRDGPSQCGKWPDGKVSYEIDSSFSSCTRIFIIEEAINDFHKKTCISWIPRQSENAFVYFVKPSVETNKTEECYTGGRRIVVIGEDFTKKEVLRQMAYTLGFGDEHLRNDRDNYIEARRDNCTIEEKYPHLNGGGFYDYHSIMHPSCNYETCLNRTYHDVYRCGISQSLSTLDVEKLNEMYNCKGCQSLRFQFLNQTGFNESELVPVFEGIPGNNKNICRVYYKGWVFVGRGNIKTGECHYYNRPTFTVRENVQFLTNPQQTKMVTWVRRGADFPQNALPGGRHGNGILFYIGRCQEEPQWGEYVFPEWISSDSTSMSMLKKSVGGATEGSTCSSFDILTCS